MDRARPADRAGWFVRDHHPRRSGRRLHCARPACPSRRQTGRWRRQESSIGRLVQTLGPPPHPAPAATRGAWRAAGSGNTRWPPARSPPPQPPRCLLAHPAPGRSPGKALRPLPPRWPHSDPVANAPPRAPPVARPPRQPPAPPSPARFRTGGSRPPVPSAKIQRRPARRPKSLGGRSPAGPGPGPHDAGPAPRIGRPRRAAPPSLPASQACAARFATAAPGPAPGRRFPPGEIPAPPSAPARPAGATNGPASGRPPAWRCPPGPLRPPPRPIPNAPARA